MAVYSMTGFGNAAATATSASTVEGSTPADAAAVTVELRSVNSRFLDIAFRMPDELRQHEGALRELVSAACRRGKIDIRVSSARGASDDWPQPSADQLSRLAREQHPSLEKGARDLAWLDLSTEAGTEYFHSMQAAGAFAVVLECVPAELAAQVTAALDIPTIGIGAGPDCDAQVLVWQDMAGLSPRVAKFVKRYADLAGVLRDAAQSFGAEVAGGTFPDAEHSYR